MFCCCLVWGGESELRWEVFLKGFFEFESLRARERDFLLLLFHLSTSPPPSQSPYLRAPVVALGLGERHLVRVDVPAVDADVSGERLLGRGQLAAKPLRGGLLRKPLDVDAGVLSLDELDADGAGRVGQRRARERQVVRRPELVAEEGGSVDDGVADRDARGGGVALDSFHDEASPGGLGGGELEGEGLVDLDLEEEGVEGRWGRERKREAESERIEVENERRRKLSNLLLETRPGTRKRNQNSP